MADAPVISGHTKTIGLIGTPVGHSLSPAMHTASFARMGEDCVYLAFDVQQQDLEAAARGMRALGFSGYNVTMPHKGAILEYCDKLSDAARLMGAVNCVDLKSGEAVGHNTDGAGFMRNLAEHDIDVVGKKMTIVGAGGAGSAIFTQAALDGMTEIDVFNVRDKFFDATVQRVAALSESTGCKLVLHDLDDKAQLQASVADSAVFVNATRVGMVPMQDECVLPAEYLHDNLAVADTVYNPRETKLLASAHARGLKAVNGLGMLLWQAAIGEEIWLGKQMDVPFIENKFFGE